MDRYAYRPGESTITNFHDLKAVMKAGATAVK
jgi:hypothetical protein